MDNLVLWKYNGGDSTIQEFRALDPEMREEVLNFLEDFNLYEEVMVGKRTISRGAFYKDVIAGHISTAKISGNRRYDGIWHDDQSHYYLDGTTYQAGVYLNCEI